MKLFRFINFLVEEAKMEGKASGEFHGLRIIIVGSNEEFIIVLYKGKLLKKLEVPRRYLDSSYFTEYIEHWSIYIPEIRESIANPTINRVIIN